MSNREKRRQYTKRSLLKATGGLAATVSVTGLASAKGNGKGGGNGKGNGKGKDDRNDSGKNDDNGNGPPSSAKNTCSDGLVLLAKYEIRDGSFVYEKDSNFLSTGDAFNLTAEATKDGGEVLAFSFNDPSKDYDVREISVKTGDGIFKKTLTGNAGDKGGDADDGTFMGSFNARNYDRSDPVQAVSNVLLCSKVFWQVDFGIGPVPSTADYDDQPDSTLLRAALGDSTDRQESITDDGELEDKNSYKGVSIPSTSKFSVNWSTGTVELGFKNMEKRQVHLVSFERPGPFGGDSEFDAQERFDAVTTTDASGTLTVDIPTPSNYS